MKMISLESIQSMAKDVTLANGAKHRCIDVTQIDELPVFEIIRCKDCVLAKSIDGIKESFKFCLLSKEIQSNNWYCPNAVPKDDNHID